MSLESEVVIVMNKLILLDFWAPWCGYCLEMNATVEAMAEEFKDKIEIKKINIDEEKELSVKYRIMGVPTYVIINAEEEILGRISGYQTREAMRSFIESCLP